MVVANNSKRHAVYDSSILARDWLVTSSKWCEGMRRKTYRCRPGLSSMIQHIHMNTQVTHKAALLKGKGESATTSCRDPILKGAKTKLNTSLYALHLPPRYKRKIKESAELLKRYVVASDTHPTFTTCTFTPDWHLPMYRSVWKNVRY